MSIGSRAGTNRLVLFESGFELKSGLGFGLVHRGLGLGRGLESCASKSFSSPLNSTIQEMYKELVAYLRVHCVLSGSAASTHAAIAQLFGKCLLTEHEYTETDISSDSPPGAQSVGI